MSPRTITIGAEITSDYSKSRDKEWLITNELGGYASSSITGINTRGYHGLLVASFGPSLQRTLLLSKLEERVVVKGETYFLSANRYPGVIYPDGYRHLIEFQLDPNPCFIYRVDGGTVCKRVHMLPKTNCTVITYETDISEGVEIEIRPLVSNRGFHTRLRENSGDRFAQHPYQRSLTVESSTSPKKLFLESNLGGYEPAETWYKNIVYDEEADRDLDDREDLFSPGVFKARLNHHEIYQILASTDATSPGDVQFGSASSGSDECSLHDWLMHASEQFVVNLPDGECHIVAGYHWFGEWGRDAAIALPGLLLTTQRYDEAKKLLERFLALSRDGLVPNLTGEDGKTNYSSIDTSLWFIYATHKYFIYTRDLKFLEKIYPKLKDIIKNYQQGNPLVRAAEDGLLVSTQKNSSLTWMDARVDDIPVTPREGKCVEVNALYYNALRILEEFSRILGEDFDSFGGAATEVKQAFNDSFWYPGGGYMYDYIEDDGGDSSIRPNQIHSISLPFPVLEKAKWGRVYKVIERNLLTPYGLRSLAPSDSKYHGKCAGPPRDRDTAYHNGTVWAWLIGPYITAHTRLGYSPNSLLILHILNSFKHHLQEAGIGSVSEIFDGDAPHKPRGCIAQAWSVGELLRIYHEDLKESKLNTI